MNPIGADTPGIGMAPLVIEFGIGGGVPFHQLAPVVVTAPEGEPSGALFGSFGGLGERRRLGLGEAEGSMKLLSLLLLLLL
eukprot:CAMPEP_0206591062 /NCGR_PEP_ID=MMETSP0325_2-20121206/40005_1 /ASSEMBLY_ACC=CAM_ASM_000347 /TAXON_ID=2866 /ORGANISM="Crypthecodinium cohnii, Strain Seligo" /LENGTH=80 /DNA_ID=CAMNT_0054100161 /DNA_START=31 /DNA_END=270 /DNA_ORIENTATION=+